MNLFSIIDEQTVQLTRRESYKMHKRTFFGFTRNLTISHTISCSCGIFLNRGALSCGGGHIMSDPPSPRPPVPLPDHIEGAHPLLGGEIRSLLFWLAPLPRAALYYHNLLLPPLLQPHFGLRLRSYCFLSLSQLCWSCQSGGLETWPGHQVERTSVAALELGHKYFQNWAKNNFRAGQQFFFRTGMKYFFELGYKYL